MYHSAKRRSAVLWRVVPFCDRTDLLKWLLWRSNGFVSDSYIGCRTALVGVLLLSSSFYWVSVANDPKVLQPYCLIVLPLDVPDFTASLLLWGPSGQRWRCLWTFLFSNVPTFAISRLQKILAAKGGTTWAKNGRWILPENARLPRNIQGSFTCRKSTTWDRRLYFPSEGGRAVDFFDFLVLPEPKDIPKRTCMCDVKVGRNEFWKIRTVSQERLKSKM